MWTCGTGCACSSFSPAGSQDSGRARRSEGPGCRSRRSRCRRRCRSRCRRCRRRHRRQRLLLRRRRNRRHRHLPRLHRSLRLLPHPRPSSTSGRPPPTAPARLTQSAQRFAARRRRSESESPPRSRRSDRSGRPRPTRRGRSRSRPGSSQLSRWSRPPRNCRFWPSRWSAWRSCSSLSAPFRPGSCRTPRSPRRSSSAAWSSPWAVLGRWQRRSWPTCWSETARSGSPFRGISI